MLIDDWKIDTYQTGSKVVACLHYADTHPTEEFSKKFISLYKDFKMPDVTK